MTSIIGVVPTALATAARPPAAIPAATATDAPQAERHADESPPETTAASPGATTTDDPETASDADPQDAAAPVPVTAMPPPPVRGRPHVGRGIDAAWNETIRRIRREHFGMQRVPERRAAGYERLRVITDPDGLRTMWLALREARADVVDVVFEHLATDEDAGPRLMAWLALTDPDPSVRYAAVLELDGRATPEVEDELLAGLASPARVIVDRAGELAGALELHGLIPDLIQHLIGYEPYTRRRGSRGLFTIVGGVSSPTISPSATLPALYWYETGSLLQTGGRTYRRSGWRPIEHGGVRRGLVVLARLSGDRETDHEFDQDAWWAWWDERQRSPAM